MKRRNPSKKLTRESLIKLLARDLMRREPYMVAYPTDARYRVSHTKSSPDTRYELALKARNYDLISEEEFLRIAPSHRNTSRKTMKRRNPRRMAKVRTFSVRTDRLGPSATGYDARGHIVNKINGGREHSEEDVRRSAKRHWPDAREILRLTGTHSKRKTMPRKNPWPSKYKTIGKKYDDCLDSIQPGYNPYAVCGATFEKKYGKKFGAMLSAKRRMNPGPVKRETSDEARELTLFAENDGDLYRQMVRPIERNLARKIKNGKYNSTLALKAWEHLATAAAQRYAKEFGGGSWHAMFPPSARREFARDWRDAFEAAVKEDGLERFLKS